MSRSRRAPAPTASRAERARARRRPSPSLDRADLARLVDLGRDLLAVVADDARVVYCSPALASALGRRRSDFVGRALAALVHAEDAATLAALAGNGARGPLVARLRLRGGAWNPFAVQCRSLPGPRRQRLRALRFESLQPAGAPTTRALPDRATLARRLDRSIRRARLDPGYGFAVLFADLDAFKLVNESLGRDRGDQLLGAVAGRLLESVRPGDLVAHSGADEFAMLLDFVISPSDSLVAAERLQQALAKPFRVGSEDLFTSACIGIALSKSGYSSAEDLLRDAATAASRAKALGPGRVELFDREMRTRALTRLRLESDLRRALERKELCVHYQPVVSLSDGALVGFEALARWQHPKRGLVSPGEFIPVAEETRLIGPIGAWVLREACVTSRGWQSAPGWQSLSLSANISPAQFDEGSVLKSVLAAVEASGLRGDCLVVEITESALLSDFNAVIAVLGELRRSGIQVHLDDFGTGFSSLGYLSRLPADAVKIDRSFVNRILEHRETEVLVRAIVELAHNLGKYVVAEGVETADQAARLAEMGCDLAQGFHYARPMDGPAAGRWLAHARPAAPVGRGDRSAGRAGS